MYVSDRRWAATAVSVWAASHSALESKVKRKVSRDDEREEQESRPRGRGYSKDLAQLKFSLSQHGLGASLVDAMAN